MTLTLRAAQSSDIPMLYALEEALFADPWSEGSLAAHLHAETTCSLVADCGGVTAGYLLCQILPPEGEILRIGTLPSHRRQGIADALLTKFFAEYPQIHEIYLEVRSSNTPAISLYQRHGFVPVGVRKKYYKNPTEDACVMKKTTLPSP